MGLRDSAHTDPILKKMTNRINRLAILAIHVFQNRIANLGYQPNVHFELEGAYTPRCPVGRNNEGLLNYDGINQALGELSIQALLKPEYWRFQWEYVSKFEGQSPLKVAEDLDAALFLLPKLLKKFGAQDVFIKPVIWGGDQSRLASGSQTLLSSEKKSVHIPNAIQINISAFDENGENAIPINGVGERLQQCLLNTSYECSLLFLPEQEAFDRLQLKRRFGLERELCSPDDLSGGQQGSIALYKQQGKHNQKMGLSPLLYDSKHRVLTSSHDWRALSRVEHRLGAASQKFNPFVNVVFALANLADALKVKRSSHTQCSQKHYGNQVNPDCSDSAGLSNAKDLPRSLFNDGKNVGAFEIFRKGQWFAAAVNQTVGEIKEIDKQSIPLNLGSLLKQAVLDFYCTSIKI